MDHNDKQELLDLYAAAALTGILSSASVDPTTPGNQPRFAQLAWEYARQMLAHRISDE
jgi:hypothetical protein